MATNLIGTNTDDVLRGTNTSESYFIAGLGGNDYLYGVDGATVSDSLWGGDDDDLIFGEDGDDVLMGGRGNDTIWGGSGTDQFLFLKDNFETDKTTKIMDYEVGEVIYCDSAVSIFSSFSVATSNGDVLLSYTGGYTSSSNTISNVINLVGAAGKTITVGDYNGNTRTYAT